MALRVKETLRYSAEERIFRWNLFTSSALFAYKHREGRCVPNPHFSLDGSVLSLESVVWTRATPHGLKRASLPPPIQYRLKAVLAPGQDKGAEIGIGATLNHPIQPNFVRQARQRRFRRIKVIEFGFRWRPRFGEMTMLSSWAFDCAGGKMVRTMTSKQAVLGMSCYVLWMPTS